MTFDQSQDEIVATIAIVDDDDDVRKSLANLLDSVGYRTSLYPSAEAFLADQAWHSSQCAILDIRMKGMSGIDLLRRLGVLNVTMPTIILTAHCDEDARARVRLEGGQAFLCKPFDEDELLDAIRTALKS